MNVEEFKRNFVRFKELKEKKSKDGLSESEIKEYLHLLEKLERSLLDNPLIGQQRRKHLRADLNLEAELIAGGAREFCKCLTIGSGGMFLQAKTKVRPGKKVRVKIKLPNNQYLTTEGEVLYTSGSDGIGLRFSDINEDRFNELREILVDYYGTMISE